MKIEIEQYRGWTIFFDTDSEEFYCHSDQYDKAETKRSFSACKKYIDDFLKENSTFKPFWVERTPSFLCGEKKLKIIGIRKDGRFISENQKGEKNQVSDYNNKDYMVVNPDNEPLWSELQGIENEIAALHNQKEAIKAKFKIRTLADVKKDLGV